MAVLLTAQRLSVTAMLPMQRSDLHAAMGESLSWTTGSLGLRDALFGEGKSVRNQRRLYIEESSNTTLRGGNDTEPERAAWTGRLLTLEDTLTTFVVALVCCPRANLQAWPRALALRY